MNSKYSRALVYATCFIVGCRAEFDSNNPANQNPALTISRKVYCQKSIKAHVPNTKIKSIDELPEKSTRETASLKEKEKFLTFTYEFTEYSDQSRAIYCTVDDGTRQYNSKNFINGRVAYLSESRCDLTYDLDDNPSFGTFSISHVNASTNLAYFDDEYQKDYNLRTSECTEL